MLCMKCFRDTSAEARRYCVDLDTAYNQGAKKLERALTVRTTYYYCTQFLTKYLLVLYALVPSLFKPASHYLRSLILFYIQSLLLGKKYQRERGDMAAAQSGPSRTIAFTKYLSTKYTFQKFGHSHKVGCLDFLFGISFPNFNSELLDI